MQRRARDCATHGPVSPTTARCHPWPRVTHPQPGALPLPGGIPEDPAVTPRRLPVNSCAVSWAMAARQDLLTAPNRAIPGSWQPAPAPAVEESLSSLGSCRRAAGTGLGQWEQSLRSAPIQFLGTHRPHPHRGQRPAQPLWGEARRWEHPFSPVTALAGRALAWGHSGTEQGGISREPMARVWGPAMATGCGSPGPADSPINIYIHSRSGAVQLPGSRWKISQAQRECKQAAGLGCR